MLKTFHISSEAKYTIIHSTSLFIPKTQLTIPSFKQSWQTPFSEKSDSCHGKFTKTGLPPNKLNKRQRKGVEGQRGTEELSVCLLSANIQSFLEPTVPAAVSGHRALRVE